MSFKEFNKKYRLPSTIKVLVRKSKEDGFYAILPDYPGCNTMGKNIGDLINNVNDAVLTYFEVPKKEAKKIDFLYLPNIPKTRVKLVLKKSTKTLYPLEFASLHPKFIYA